MKLIHPLLTAALTLTCVAASAQWQWIDKDGRKVFSDRAPPAEILEKNILKRPAGHAKAQNTQDKSDSESESAPAAPVPPLPANTPKAAGVDRELEAKKKLAQDAELAKRKAEEERVTKAKIENCARAKQAKITFTSGVRVARSNAAGEREILDDAARTAELKHIQTVIDSECK